MRNGQKILWYGVSNWEKNVCEKLKQWAEGWFRQEIHLDMVDLGVWTGNM